MVGNVRIFLLTIPNVALFEKMGMSVPKVVVEIQVSMLYRVSYRIFSVFWGGVTKLKKKTTCLKLSILIR